MKNGKKIALLILVDALAFIIVSLIILNNVFNWLGLQEIPEPVVLSRPSPTPAPTQIEVSHKPTSTPDSELVPDATPAPTPEPTPSGLCGGNYPDRFSYDGIINTDTRYASENVDIEISYYEVNGVHYQIADIYVQNIENFATYAVRGNEDKARLPKMAESLNAIVAINGDMSVNSRTHGWIVRNGEEYQNKRLDADICILYWDGTMETYDYKNDFIDYDAIYAKGPYQIWYFGPELLDNEGNVKTSFNLPDSIGGANPRTVVGYYAPGHYAFIVVEGTRNGGDSKGLSLENLSKLCADLGMTSAYNLDGGGSSTMYYQGAVFGHNSRSTSDALYIHDNPQQ